MYANFHDPGLDISLKVVWVNVYHFHGGNSLNTQKNMFRPVLQFVKFSMKDHNIKENKTGFSMKDQDITGWLVDLKGKTGLLRGRLQDDVRRGEGLSSCFFFFYVIYLSLVFEGEVQLQIQANLYVLFD